MQRTARYALLIGILTLASFLRFFHFTTTPPGLYQDEAMDGNNAVEVAETGHFQPFYVEADGREGLYVNLIAVFLKICPIYEPWVIRLPAAVAGVLTVWGMYLLGEELFTVDVGLLAAFLLATSFWHINFSRIGFRAILSPLLLVWVLYLLVKSFRKDSGLTASLLSIAAGIVYGLGFYTYIAFRVTPVLLLLFPLLFGRYRGFGKRTAAFVAAAIAAAAPMAWYFFQHPGDFLFRASKVSVTSDPHPLYRFVASVFKTAVMFNFRGDYNWRHNVSGAPELFWPVGILFLLGIVLACLSLRQGAKNGLIEGKGDDAFKRFGLTLMLAWLVFGALPAVMTREGIPHALRSILMLPPAMVLSALGGVWAYRRIAERWRPLTARVCGVVFVIAVAGFGYYQYFVVWAQSPVVAYSFNEDCLKIGRTINAMPRSTPKYVIAKRDSELARDTYVTVEPVMFITHSFTEADARAANIHYLNPGEENRIPAGTTANAIFTIP